MSNWCRNTSKMKEWKWEQYNLTIIDWYHKSSKQEKINSLSLSYKITIKNWHENLSMAFITVRMVDAKKNKLDSNQTGNGIWLIDVIFQRTIGIDCIAIWFWFNQC